MATEINDVTKIRIRNAKNGDFDLNLSGGSGGGNVPFYPVLITGGSTNLGRYVSSYTHGTCRTHMEVNGKLCPVFTVKIGNREYEVLQMERGMGQPYIYSYYRLTRDGNMNVIEMEYLKFQINFTDVGSLSANETVFRRKDGGMFRAYYYDAIAEEYKWIGAVGTPVKYAVAQHEQYPYYIYATVGADQFVQVTNLNNTAYTLTSKFYEVSAIVF